MKAIVILGAAMLPDGPSPALIRRARHGAQVRAATRADLVVVCGGPEGTARTEADAMAGVLIEEGVPDRMILRERRSATTFENLAFACPMLAECAVSEIVLVSDGYHLPRARMVARHLGLRATAAPAPWSGRGPLTRARLIAREMLALISYAVRLRLGPAMGPRKRRG